MDRLEGKSMKPRKERVLRIMMVFDRLPEKYNELESSLLEFLVIFEALGS